MTFIVQIKINNRDIFFLAKKNYTIKLKSRLFFEKNNFYENDQIWVMENFEKS